MRCGDEVFGVAEGALRSFIESSRWFAALIPRGLSGVEMSSLPTVSLTLAAAMDFGRVVHGDVVVIQAGAGGTGCAALAALRRCGALPMATAGNAKKQCFLRVRCGVQNVSSTRSGQTFLLDFFENLPPRCLGASFMVNSLTHDDFIPRGLSILAPGGRAVELGKLRVWSVQAVNRFREDILYATMLLDARTMRAAPTLAVDLRAIAAAVHARELKLPPMSVFDFSDALQALKLLQSAQHVGKVVITCGPCGQWRQ